MRIHSNFKIVLFLLMAGLELIVQTEFGFAATSHYGNSPFNPPEETDSSFVTDSAPKLDQYLYVDSSPISFDIEVKRYVGETNSDGTLANAANLVANKVISATATLKMPVYDVDDDYSGSYYVKEIDELYFNSHFVGLLSGGNENWKLNSFDIPIEIIKFPQKGTNGSAPTPAKNNVEIHIDTGNGGETVWAVEVDWAELSFEAMPPVVLIHGNGQNGAFWDNRGFTEVLKEHKIPYDNSINLPTATVVENGGILQDRISKVTKSMGVKNIQIVAHSKGGLDTREFLGTYYPSLERSNELKVHTFITLSTPHRGSVGADYIEATRLTTFKLENPNDRTEFAEWYSSDYKKEDFDANKNLTTQWTAAFNKKNQLGNDIQYYSVGADADINGNGSLERNEYQEMLDMAGHSNIWDPLVNKKMNVMYQALGKFSSVTANPTGRNSGFPFYIPTYEVVETPTSNFQENDMMVTVSSAKFTFDFIGQFGKNHASVADGEVAGEVIKHLKYADAE